MTLTTCLAGALACEGARPSPTGPEPPLPIANPAPFALARLSGTVWFLEVGGATPYAGARLYVWLERPRSGGPGGSVVTDAEGRYEVRAEVGSIVRLFQGPPPYQPCDVAVTMNGDVSRDLHVVADPRQFGAALPPPLISQFPIVSGVVVEGSPDGPRPVSDVIVYSDSTGSGGDVLTAATVTGSDGRYVLCGFERSRPASVIAWKPGYPLVGKTLALDGDTTTLDIRLRD